MAFFVKIYISKEAIFNKEHLLKAIIFYICTLLERIYLDAKKYNNLSLLIIMLPCLRKFFLRKLCPVIIIVISFYLYTNYIFKEYKSFIIFSSLIKRVLFTNIYKYHNTWRILNCNNEIITKSLIFMSLSFSVQYVYLILVNNIFKIIL